MVVGSENRRTKQKRRVGLLYDDRMCKHAPPNKTDWPEIPDRIKSIWNKLQTAGIPQRCVLLDAKEVEDNQVLLVHSQNHLKLMKDISSKKFSSRRKKIASKYDSIYFNKGSSEAASLAAGSVVQVIEQVAKGELSSGVAIVRPPGHHAEHDKPIGFCLYNNVAIAAKFILNEKPELGIKRILIVDWDVHHGNGTQKMFWEDPRVLFFSVHRHEFGNFFPFNDDGFYTMVGNGPGAGYNINVPWENSQCGDADYIAVWDHILIPVAKEFNPDMIIVSAGFDAAVNDPLGECLVTPFGYSVMLKKLMDFAHGKVVLAFEGGYNLESTASSMLACVEVLLDDKPNDGSSDVYPLESTWRVIKAVRHELHMFWPVLAEELPKTITNQKVPLIPYVTSSSSDSEVDSLDNLPTNKSSFEDQFLTTMATEVDNFISHQFAADPMEAILATLARAHSPDVFPPPTSSQMVTPGKASSSAPPNTIDFVDEGEVLLEEAEEGEEEQGALPEEVEESEKEQDVAMVRKRKGKMVAEESSKSSRRVDTPTSSHDSGIPLEAEEYTVPHGIVLTPVPGDEERQELRIAKYNYALDEYTRGHAEVEALRRVLREEVQNSFNEENFRNPWDLNLDPLTDWFSCFLGPTLAPFASEITGEYVSQLTRCAPKQYAACASLNFVYQVQDISHALAAITAEAGRLSKTIINHGFVLSEFGGIDEVVKILQDLSAERRAFQEEAERKEALAKAKFEEEAKQRETQAEAMIREEVLRRDRLEVRHREALRAEGEATAKAKHELREAKKALDEMAAKVRSLEELHQADLESRANLAVEIKELKDFKDQALKKAKRDELLSPVSCSRCIMRFDDGVYMA